MRSTLILNCKSSAFESVIIVKSIYRSQIHVAIRISQRSIAEFSIYNNVVVSIHIRHSSWMIIAKLRELCTYRSSMLITRLLDCIAKLISPGLFHSYSWLLAVFDAQSNLYWHLWINQGDWTYFDGNESLRRSSRLMALNSCSIEFSHGEYDAFSIMLAFILRAV